MVSESCVRRARICVRGHTVRYSHHIGYRNVIGTKIFEDINSENDNEDLTLKIIGFISDDLALLLS